MTREEEVSHNNLRGKYAQIKVTFFGLTLRIFDLTLKHQGHVMSLFDHAPKPIEIFVEHYGIF